MRPMRFVTALLSLLFLFTTNAALIQKSFDKRVKPQQTLNVAGPPRIPRRPYIISTKAQYRRDQPEPRTYFYRKEHLKHFIPSSTSQAPSFSQTAYTGLDGLENSGYLYALNAKKPLGTQHDGLPGFIGQGNPSATWSHIRKLQYLGYRSFWTKHACQALTELLEIDGLTTVSEIPVPELTKPQYHYIALVLIQRSPLDSLLPPALPVHFYRLNSNGMWSIKHQFEAPDQMILQDQMDSFNQVKNYLRDYSNLVSMSRAAFCGLFRVDKPVKDALRRMNFMSKDVLFDIDEN